MRAKLFGLIYKITRRIIIAGTYGRQEDAGHPKDLEDAVIYGDHRMKQLSKYLGLLLFHFRVPKDSTVKLFDLEFPSPITVASFKDDLEILRIWLNLGAGGACIKTIQKEASSGNPRPRLQEVKVNKKRGLLNAMGLPGKGVNALIEDLEDSKLFKKSRPIGLSIGGTSIQEYQDVFLVLEDWLTKTQPGPTYYELNISCPNTPEGQQITKNPKLLDGLLGFMREHSDHVIGVKLSPDQSNPELQKIAEICQGYKKIFLNLGNTQYKSCEDVKLSPKAISVGGGGLSGPALFSRTCEMVELLAPTKLPIMATGGISTPDHIKILQNKGASLFGIATGLVTNPYCISILNQVVSKKES